MISRINRFLAGLEWRWSLGTALWGMAIPATSVVLPAWATRAAGVFSEYAPLSWVVAGFIGLAVYVILYFLASIGYKIKVKSKYDALLLRTSGFIDPMAIAFEKNRIVLSEFCLPSHSWIDGKTFVDCEIIGPANIFIISGNRIDEMNVPVCDAVVVADGKSVFNCYNVVNCTFRRCKFVRCTFIVSEQEYNAAPGMKDHHMLNWISYRPDSDFPLLDD